MAKRTALDLEGLGGIVADKLVESGLVGDPLDLFELEQQHTLAVQLAGLNLGTPEEPRVFGQKNALKLSDAVKRARTLPLARWLHALAIPEVGETIAYELASTHTDLPSVAFSPLLDAVLEKERLEILVQTTKLGARANRGLSPEQKERMERENETASSSLKLVEDKLITGRFAKRSSRKDGSTSVLCVVGPVVARAVLEYFASEAGISVLKRLSKLDIHPLGAGKAGSETHSGNQAASGKTFVLTGTLPTLSRSETTELIRSVGGTVSSSVSRKTDYLVAGAEAGSKLEEAKRLGVQILDEAGLLKLVDSGERPAAAPKQAELF